MHEVGIADSVLRLVTDHAAGRRVVTVEVEVGRLHAIDPAALAFGFELAALGTPVEGAKLEIAEIAAIVRCRACAEERELTRPALGCASCGSVDVEMASGKELRIVAIEVEEAAGTPVTAGPEPPRGEEGQP